MFAEVALGSYLYPTKQKKEKIKHLKSTDKLYKKSKTTRSKKGIQLPNITEEKSLEE